MSIGPSHSFDCTSTLSSGALNGCLTCVLNLGQFLYTMLHRNCNGLTGRNLKPYTDELVLIAPRFSRKPYTDELVLFAPNFSREPYTDELALIGSASAGNPTQTNWYGSPASTSPLISYVHNTCIY